MTNLPLDKNSPHTLRISGGISTTTGAVGNAAMNASGGGKSGRNAQTQSKITCKRHPNKKIKFMCEIHKEFLCTICVLDHTGVGHKVASFSADCIYIYIYIVESMKSTLSGLNNRYQNILVTLSKQNEEAEKKEQQQWEVHQKMVGKVNKIYEESVRKLNDKRKYLLDLLKHNVTEYQHIVDQHKTHTCQKVEKAVHSSNQLDNFMQYLGNIYI